MIPWVLERGRVPVADVAARFGISVEDATKDLMTAGCIGLPPYTGDVLVDMYLDGGLVHAHAGALFRRPPRLSAAEGLAVLAAGRALLDVPGADPDGALASALAKLESAVGGHVAVDVDPPPLLGVVRDAVEQGVRLEIDYWSAYREEASTRVIDPEVVFRHRNGRWYVDAGGKHYRVDRISRAAPTGERFAPVRKPPPDSVYDPGPGARRVEVVVPPGGRWVVETYPVEWEERPDGSLLVTFTVVGTRWLERVLLRLGPEAEVVGPDDCRDVGRDAARRLLARYDAG
jgi:proteasome accessory factor C